MNIQARLQSRYARLFFAIWLSIGFSQTAAAWDVFKFFKRLSGTSTADQTAVEVTELLIRPGENIDNVVDHAAELVAETRRKNPHIEKVEVVLVSRQKVDKRGNQTDQPTVVAKLINDRVDDSHALTLEYGKYLNRYIQVPEYDEDNDPSLKHAQQEMAPYNSKISVIRFWMAGAVSAIAILVNEPSVASLGPALSAFVFGGLISKEIQRIDDYYKEKFLMGAPFWAPAVSWLNAKGKKFTSFFARGMNKEKFPYRVVSENWQKLEQFGTAGRDRAWALVKESAMLTGYLMSMYWAVAWVEVLQDKVFGSGNATEFLSQGEYFQDPQTWALGALYLGTIAAVSEGSLIYRTAQHRARMLRDNWIRNQHNGSARLEGNKNSIKFSYLTAIMLSGIGTFSQVTGIAGLKSLGKNIMIAMGVAGGAGIIFKADEWAYKAFNWLTGRDKTFREHPYEGVIAEKTREVTPSEAPADASLPCNGVFAPAGVEL